MMDIFAFPKFLWLVFYALLSALALTRWIPGKRRRLLSLIVAAPKLRRALAGDESSDRRGSKAVLVAAGLLLIALAMAGPQWGIKSRDVPLLGSNLMICLDVSESMLAQDVKPNRFERSKLEMVEAFTKKNGQAPMRVGLVTFAGRAYLQCPLTLDANALRFILETVAPGTLPHPGTNIAAALKTAQAILSKAGGDRHVLVATDGEDHEGDARAMIGELVKNRIRVSVLWTGSPEGEPIPQRDENGNFLGYKKDRSGQTVLTRAKGDSLEGLARQTGGRFIRLDNNTDPQAELKNIAEEADAKKGKGQEMRLENRYQIPLGLGFLLLLAEFALPERKRK
ncbi:MAG: VWA domain-containing protein [Elusimicrobia bacterium]|nr:VWA domain-containing protein [Elusimicrobiota bacterium]